MLEQTGKATGPTSSSFIELEPAVRGGKFRNFCEVCVSMMQSKMRGEKDICENLNADYEITCVENMESLLHADKALVYFLKNGCVYMDSTGPKVIRPCPAVPICGFVPNIFAQPPFVSEDGIEALCPRDPKFLPTVPQEYKALLSGE